MEYDDESYEEVRLGFSEKVYGIQNECLNYCHELIDKNEGIILNE